jgi:pimeloyl-ACP methyl ester carboxylesterase
VSPNPTRGAITRGVAAVSGAGLVAAGWAWQHRAAARAAEEAEEELEALALPPDTVRRDIEVDDGASIHVVEKGNGPPLVLLHGVTLTSALWGGQLRDLSGRFRVIALDLRGHGRSTIGRDGFHDPGSGGRRRGRGSPARRSPGTPAMRRLATDVHEVLRALEIEGALLAGHSMGGMVAMQLCNELSEEERRQRLSGLALISTTAGPVSGLPGWTAAARVVGPAIRRELLIFDRVGRGVLRSGDVSWWVSRLPFGSTPSPSQVRFTEEMLLATSSRALADLVPALGTFNLSTSLEVLDMPTTVVVGTRDRVTPPAHARRLVAAVHDAELVELPRCGHMPMLERPVELAAVFDTLALRHGTPPVG